MHSKIAVQHSSTRIEEANHILRIITDGGTQHSCSAAKTLQGFESTDYVDQPKNHLAQLSPLGVPVGHIAVPGGAKLPHLEH